MNSRELPAIDPGSILPEQVLQSLSRVGAIRQFAAGDVIFRNGDPGEEMYIIEDGAVGLIFEEGKSGKRLTRGSFFGELSLFSRNRIRTATAIAAEYSRLRILGQDTFDDLLKTHAALLAKLLLQTCAYLVDSEQNLITDLQRRNRELEQTLDYLRRTRRELDSAELLLQMDALTGLYNRRCLEGQIQDLLTRANELPEGIALLIADIDHFKAINDTHGHHVGDVVLKQFAALIKQSVRQSDLPCRLGGDEFAVILPDVAADKSFSVVSHVSTSVGGLTVSLPHTELAITASIGGTLYRHGEDWESFFSRADENLYLAKESGRHSFGWDGSVRPL